ncbi:MAG: hypothetical protein ACP5EP_09165 [Acidobacteriaceae bacterium]
MRDARKAGLVLALALALPLGCHSNKNASQNAANGNGGPNGQNAPGQATNPGSAPYAQGNGPASNGPMGANNGSYASNGQGANNYQAPAPQPTRVPAGTLLRVRLNDSINVKSARDGDAFTGTLAEPVSVHGQDVVPAGTPVDGVITAAHKRGRFKGASVLQLRLTGMDMQGHHYRLDTGHYTRSKKGKGRRSALMIGGGSGLGMLVGGLATGGVGLVVGGLAGAGAGTAGAAFTGNKDISIPAESILSFRLDGPVTLQP